MINAVCNPITSGNLPTDTLTLDIAASFGYHSVQRNVMRVHAFYGADQQTMDTELVVKAGTEYDVGAFSTLVVNTSAQVTIELTSTDATPVVSNILVNTVSVFDCGCSAKIKNVSASDVTVRIVSVR